MPRNLLAYPLLKQEAVDDAAKTAALGMNCKPMLLFCWAGHGHRILVAPDSEELLWSAIIPV